MFGLIILANMDGPTDMTHKHCILIGAPVDCGKRTQGCLMGPDAYRTAGISQALQDLGHTVEDMGNLSPTELTVPTPKNPVVHDYAKVIGWTDALMKAAQDAAPRGFPIFMGGDHALAAGTVAGMAAYAKSIGRPFFVLWLDAHSDIHTPDSTDSGNLHGTPTGYYTGRDGFQDFPPLPAPVDMANMCMVGLRSVDPAEHDVLNQSEMTLIDMRRIDEEGIAAPLADFLNKVKAVDGMLHVSLDVDFLDPSVAPAVGTTVPGGATVREGHLIMEMVSDADCVCSLDLVELNPFLDNRGQTANLMTDLTASLLGRRVFDRLTPSNT